MLADEKRGTRENGRDSQARLALDVLHLAFEVQGQLSSLLALEGRDHRLSPSEAVTLLRLAQGPSPVSGVARAAGIRPNGASVLVDRLHSRRLVQRQRDRRDNRVVTVQLTPTGQNIASELTRRVGERLRETFGSLTKAESEQLAKLLRRVGDID
jgi:DNA-binding MarR family transcriptional regulator